MTDEGDGLRVDRMDRKNKGGREGKPKSSLDGRAGKDRPGQKKDQTHIEKMQRQIDGVVSEWTKAVQIIIEGKTGEGEDPGNLQLKLHVRGMPEIIAEQVPQSSDMGVLDDIVKIIGYEGGVKTIGIDEGGRRRHQEK